MNPPPTPLQSGGPEWTLDLDFWLRGGKLSCFALRLSVGPNCCPRTGGLNANQLGKSLFVSHFPPLKFMDLDNIHWRTPRQLWTLNFSAAKYLSHDDRRRGGRGLDWQSLRGVPFNHSDLPHMSEALWKGHPCCTNESSDFRTVWSSRGIWSHRSSFWHGVKDFRRYLVCVAPCWVNFEATLELGHQQNIDFCLYSNLFLSFCRHSWNNPNLAGPKFGLNKDKTTTIINHQADNGFLMVPGLFDTSLGQDWLCVGVVMGSRCTKRMKNPMSSSKCWLLDISWIGCCFDIIFWTILTQLDQSSVQREHRLHWPSIIRENMDFWRYLVCFGTLLGQVWCRVVLGLSCVISKILSFVCFITYFDCFTVIIWTIQTLPDKKDQSPGRTSIRGTTWSIWHLVWFKSNAVLKFRHWQNIDFVLFYDLF